MGEKTSNDLQKFFRDIGTTQRVLEEGTPWENKAELYIGLLKEESRKDMKYSNCPVTLWNYCVERRARINSTTAKDIFQLRLSKGHNKLTGDEGDIFNLCWFK